jgi:hypothetical protein
VPAPIFYQEIRTGQDPLTESIPPTRREIGPYFGFPCTFGHYASKNPISFPKFDDQPGFEPRF